MDDYEEWAARGQWVRTSENSEASWAMTGRVVGYQPAPTLVVEASHGARVQWPASWWEEASPDDPDAWMADPRWAEFRAALAYARGKYMAGPVLAGLSSRDAYYVWSTINNGVEWQRRRDERDERAGLT